jgi:hypothetical protein
MIGIAYFFIFASPTNFDLNYSIMSNTNAKREKMKAVPLNRERRGKSAHGRIGRICRV